MLTKAQTLAEAEAAKMRWEQAIADKREPYVVDRFWESYQAIKRLAEERRR